jgi:hypothetical protein
MEDGVGKVVKNLFGGGEQEKLLKKQQRELRAVEAGQKAVRQGGRGLLAYVDEELPKALGGGSAGSIGTRLQKAIG